MSSKSEINPNINIILWKLVINKKVKELLTIISKEYPNDFNNDNYTKTILHFKKLIEYEQYIPQDKSNSNEEEQDPKGKKKNKDRKIPTDDLRCWARCWKIDDPNGYRCTLHKSGSLYCKSHEKNLPHGKFGVKLTPTQLVNFQKNGVIEETKIITLSNDIN